MGGRSGQDFTADAATASELGDALTEKKIPSADLLKRLRKSPAVALEYSYRILDMKPTISTICFLTLIVMPVDISVEGQFQPSASILQGKTFLHFALGLCVPQIELVSFGIGTSVQLIPT